MKKHGHRRTLCSKRYRLFLGFIFGVIIASSVNAKTVIIPDSPPPTTAQELDQRLGELFKDTGVPGASVSVIENGKMVLSKGYGIANVETQQPVNQDTMFRAGSISKSLVGVAVMMLVEEGKLDLNAKLSDLAPEIKFNNPWETTNPVRLVHLLEHSTGFDDLRPSQYFLDGHGVSLAKAIELYGPYTCRWQPGTYMSYSNVGPVIAAYIVEKVSGLSWAEFTQTRIFTPLGMSSARWVRDPALSNRLSKSYRSDGVTEFPYTDIPGKPAGGLNLSAPDLAKFVGMLIGRGAVDGLTLLKPESVARIETPESTLASRLGLTNGYGLGNQTDPRDKAVFHGHEGSIDAFEAYYAYQAQHAAGMVLMLNGHSESILDASELIAGYLQRTWPEPVKPNSVVNGENLESLTGTYQLITPRQQWMMPMYRLLDWSSVTAVDGGLQFEGVKRIQVAPGIFQRVDTTAPTVVFTRTDEGTLLLTGDGARRRVPMAEIIAKSVYAGVYVLCLLGGVAWVALWLFAKRRNRFQESGIGNRHWLPSLALVTPLAFALVLMNTAPEALASRSWSAILLCGLSVIMPITGCAALVTAITRSENIRRALRVWAWVSAILVIVAGVYFAHYGWIGLRTWS